MMSDTPITDAYCKQILEDGLGLEYAATELQHFAEKLERELEETKEQLRCCNVDQLTTAAELAEAQEELNDRKKFSYAVELALEGFKGDYIEIIKELVAAKKSAEPVAYMYASIAGQIVLHRVKPIGVADAWCVQKQLENDIEVAKLHPLAHSVTPLYAAPPRREWVWLTDEELAEFSNMKLGSYDLCLEIEAKLKEKNT